MTGTFHGPVTLLSIDLPLRQPAIVKASVLSVSFVHVTRVICEETHEEKGRKEGERKGRTGAEKKDKWRKKREWKGGKERRE